jgi:hypothetical protein
MEKLDKLIANGAVDSQEADSLRNQMDLLWLRMTGDERTKFNLEVKDVRLHLPHLR